MTREERRALLGDEAIAQIHERVAVAPEPSDELVEELRRILTPAARTGFVSVPKAARPASSADAA